jgi:hypothetical protein
VAETILLKGETGKETKRMFQVWLLEVKRWAQTYESCLGTLQANITSQRKDHELLQLEQKKVGDSMGYSELVSFSDLVESYWKYYMLELQT